MIESVPPWDFGPKMVNFASPEEGLTPSELAEIDSSPELYARGSLKSR